MLKLHFAPNSRAGRIVWLLEELGLPYEINKMAFHPEALKSDEHRQRHPLGRVPVLDDGDVSIYESGAIVEYILERHKNGGLKPAVEAPEFPAYLQWFHYCEGMTMPPINTIVSHPAITSVFMETTKTRHVVDNMGAGIGRLPDADQRQRMLALIKLWT